MKVGWVVLCAQEYLALWDSHVLQCEKINLNVIVKPLQLQDLLCLKSVRDYMYRLWLLFYIALKVKISNKERFLISPKVFSFLRLSAELGTLP